MYYSNLQISVFKRWKTPYALWSFQIKSFKNVLELYTKENVTNTEDKQNISASLVKN